MEESDGEIRFDRGQVCSAKELELSLTGDREPLKCFKLQWYDF